MEHELGDVLFAWANLARKLGVHPDVALRKANQRFRSRFHQVESSFGGDAAAMKSAGLDAMEEAIGRATEMGKPVLYVPGIDDANNIQRRANLQDAVAAAAGADTFVAGSAIFGSEDYAATISAMKSEIEK